MRQAETNKQFKYLNASISLYAHIVRKVGANDYFFTKFTKNCWLHLIIVDLVQAEQTGPCREEGSNKSIP